MFECTVICLSSPYGPLGLIQLLKIMKLFGDWILTFTLIEQIQLLFLPTRDGELRTTMTCHSVTM